MPIPQVYGNTFNKDFTFTVLTEDAARVLKCLYNLISGMKYGLAKAPFKITTSEDEDGLTAIRIRAYSTKNWDHAAERLTDILNRTAYPFQDVRIKCSTDAAYYTVGDYVRKGHQSDGNENLFTNTLGNCVYEMDYETGDIFASLRISVKDISAAAADKFFNFCETLQDSLDELKEETNFAELVAKLDPEVVEIEERLEREHQQRKDAERRAAEMAERRAKFAEREKARAQQEKDTTVNRFSKLAVDEPDTEPHRAKKTASWATKTSAYTPERELVQPRTHKPRAQPKAAATAAPAEPTTQKPAATNSVRKNPCRFAENCKNYDCTRDHPPERDVSKLVPKEEYNAKKAASKTRSPRKHSSEIPCRDGERCTRDDCKFAHEDNLGSIPEEDIRVEEPTPTYHISTQNFEDHFPSLSGTTKASSAWGDD
jgi:hypothetical protein